MTARLRAALELVLAVAAATGCVASWLWSQTTEVIPPVVDGEPAISSVTFYPPLIVLAMMLGTLAGVLVVVGLARWRRST